MADSLLKERLPRNDDENKRLLCLYIQPAEPFEEVEEFVGQCSNDYRIRVKTPREGSLSMQRALQVFCDENPKLSACLMGCRRTDPYCDKLLTFDV